MRVVGTLAGMHAARIDVETHLAVLLDPRSRSGTQIITWSILVNIQNPLWLWRLVVCTARQATFSMLACASAFLSEIGHADLLDRLGHVRHDDMIAAGEIGDRAGDFRECDGRRAPKAQASSRPAAKSSPRRFERAMRVHVAGPKLRVRLPWRSIMRARAISTRSRIPLALALAWRARAHPDRHRRHLDLQVDAIEQRSGDAARDSA